MDTIRFVKSFSKGQITIPKEFRDALGIVNEFWLKLYVENGKIIAEPIEEKNNREAWRKMLLQMPQLIIDIDEIQRNRKQLEKQIKKRSL